MADIAISLALIHQRTCLPAELTTGVELDEQRESRMCKHFLRKDLDHLKIHTSMDS